MQSLQKYLEGVLKAAEDQFDGQTRRHEAQWRGAWLENADRLVRDQSARCWEHGAWPDVVTIANAVARSLLTDPPVLFESVPSGNCQGVPKVPSRLTKAVLAWRAQGLAAVPLCELVAALVCVP